VNETPKYVVEKNKVLHFWVVSGEILGFILSFEMSHTLARSRLHVWVVVSCDL
jgi:hypothetical protein